MLQRVKKTFIYSAIYSTSNIATKLVGFILLPLYTSKLVPSDYGIWSILEITLLLFSQILTLGQNQSLIRFYYQLKDELSRKRLYTTIMALIAFIGLGFGLLGEWLSPYLASFFHRPQNFQLYFQLFFPIVTFRLINSLNLSALRAKERPVAFAGLNIAKFFLICILNIWFLAFLHMGIEGILLGYLIGEVFLWLASQLLLIRDLIFQFNFSILHSTIKFGLPFIISSLSWLFLNMGDRYILKLLTNYASVGIYSLGYKIGNSINILFVQPFILSFYPYAYKIYQQKGDKRYYGKMFIYLTFVLAWAGLLLSIFSQEIIHFVARKPSYWKAWSIIPIISFAYIFSGARAVVTIAFHLKNKTQYPAALTGLAAILNLALNFLLIPWFSIWGAACATLVALAFQLFISYRLARNIYPIPYEWYKFFLILGTWVVLFAASLGTAGFPFGWRVLLKLSLVGVFPFLLYLGKFYETIELQTLQRGWIFLRNLASKSFRG